VRYVPGAPRRQISFVGSDSCFPGVASSALGSRAARSRSVDKLAV